MYFKHWNKKMETKRDDLKNPFFDKLYAEPDYGKLAQFFIINYISHYIDLRNCKANFWGNVLEGWESYSMRCFC